MKDLITGLILGFFLGIVLTVVFIPDKKYVSKVMIPDTTITITNGVADTTYIYTFK